MAFKQRAFGGFGNSPSKQRTATPPAGWRAERTPEPAPSAPAAAGLDYVNPVESPMEQRPAKPSTQAGINKAEQYAVRDAMGGPVEGSPLPITGWIKKKAKSKVKEAVKKKVKKDVKKKVKIGTRTYTKGTGVGGVNVPTYIQQGGKTILNPSHPEYIKLQSNYLKQMKKLRKILR